MMREGKICVYLGEMSFHGQGKHSRRQWSQKGLHVDKLKIKVI